MSFLTLQDYFDRHGVDVDQLAATLLQYSKHLTYERRAELIRALQPEEKSAAQVNLINLAEEARKNLELARNLRDSMMGPRGSLNATPAEVSRALQAVDRVLDGASKRFSALYNQSTMQALEEAVKEAFVDLDQDTYEKFMTILEDKLRTIR